VAVVISNGADLLEPVRMVREELGRTVGVLRVEGGQRRCTFSGRAEGSKLDVDEHAALIARCDSPGTRVGIIM